MFEKKKKKENNYRIPGLSFFRYVLPPEVLMEMTDGKDFPTPPPI